MRVFTFLSDASITYVTFGAVDGEADSHDSMLQLHAGGTWTWHPACPKEIPA